MATPNNHVWEWMDNKRWTPYDATTAGILETAYQNNPNQALALSHGFYSKDGYSVDFQQMKQINNRTKFSRKIRRRIQSQTGSSSSSVLRWQWKDDSGYVDYDDTTTNIIEKAYQDQSQTELKLNHGFFGKQGGYTIDFVTMKQTKDVSSFERKIQRDPPAAPKKPVLKAAGRWFFQKLDEDWPEFDKIASRLLEANCSRNVPTFILSHGDYAKQKGGPWKVDFKNLVVFKVDDPGKRTFIKRDPPATSSVYGTHTGNLSILSFTEDDAPEKFDTDVNEVKKGL